MRGVAFSVVLEFCEGKISTRQIFGQIKPAHRPRTPFLASNFHLWFAMTDIDTLGFTAGARLDFLL
jgi:hypothetical protein